MSKGDNNLTTKEGSLESLNISPTPSTEIPPSVMAISNLRCPSPPPILTNSGRNSTKSPPVLKLGENETDNRPTIPSGGVTVKEKEKDLRPTIFDNKELHLFVAHPPIDSPVSNASTASLDFISHPPKESAHHKVPSVHAHFYVDEALKVKGNRSRSGSTSATSDNGANIKNSIVSKNIGSLEKLAGHSTVASPTLNQGEQNANIDPRLPQDDGKIHVLFGVCGALSAAKIKIIILRLLEIYGADQVSIQLILTKSAEKFISAEILQYLENVRKIKIWRDQDEWETWHGRSDPVLHIELRRWADIFIVCPLTANTLSKIALGLCDNLLTNVIRAWNTAYPILLAPSMVSYSYNAVTTKRQLRLLAEEMPWIEILKPVEKVVGSYGDIGMGGMMDHNEIVNKIVLKLGGYPDEDDDEEEDDSERKANTIDETLVDDEDDDEDDDDDDDEDEDEDEESNSQAQGESKVTTAVNEVRHDLGAVAKEVTSLKLGS